MASLIVGYKMGMKFWLLGVSSPDIWTMQTRVGIDDSVRVLQVPIVEKEQIRTAIGPDGWKDLTSYGEDRTAGPTEQDSVTYMDQGIGNAVPIEIAHMSLDLELRCPLSPVFGQFRVG
jgi:hypothetical protein